MIREEALIAQNKPVTKFDRKMMPSEKQAPNRGSGAIR